MKVSICNISVSTEIFWPWYKTYYTFKLRCTPVYSQCSAAVASFPSNSAELLDSGVKKILLDADDVTSKRVEITKITKFPKINCMSFLLPHFACILVHLWLFWMYNKTVIGFGLRMIARIIQTEVKVICGSRRLGRLTLTEVWIILDVMLSIIQ